MASLSSSLSPCAGPRHPHPRRASMTHCIHSPSCSCLGSFAFMFTVPCVCVCGLVFVASCLCSHLWPCVRVHVCDPSHLRLWPCIRVCVCNPSCLHLRPCVCVCIRSPSHSCLCLQSLAFVFVFAVPCIHVYNWPLAFVVFTTAPSLALTCVGYI
jgi:hypothetical protein